MVISARCDALIINLKHSTKLFMDETRLALAASCGRPTGILLAGDETALPAIARILEDMPAGKRVVAMIEIADDGERQQLHTKAALDLRWLSRNSRPAGTTMLLVNAVRTLDFPDDGTPTFVWVGCEHSAAREIRAHLRKERDLPRRSSLVAAYWRRGTSGEIEDGA